MRASRTMIPLLDLTHSHTELITSSELLMAFFLEAEEEGCLLYTSDAADE